MATWNVFHLFLLLVISTLTFSASSSSSEETRDLSQPGVELPSDGSEFLQLEEEKRRSGFRSDLGKRDAAGGDVRRVLEELLWDPDQVHDRFESEEKRLSRFRTDLGKRRYRVDLGKRWIDLGKRYPSLGFDELSDGFSDDSDDQDDEQKRAKFRTDLGKRSGRIQWGTGKRVYRSDLGKRRYRTDLG